MHFLEKALALACYSTLVDGYVAKPVEMAHSQPVKRQGGPGGASTINVPRPQVGPVPYGNIITTCREPGMVALTFDDGPYSYTENLLDILDQNNVKATFFIVGDNLDRGFIDDPSTPWPSLLQRMYQSGHHLASHTFTHADLTASTRSTREQQMVWNEMSFRNIFGWFPRYMRPPYATCTRDSGCLSDLTELGYHVVNFNLDTKDYLHTTPDTVQIVKDKYAAELSPDSSQNSYIVLAHDTHATSADTLARFMIQRARDSGYRLVTLGECLGDPRSNWYISTGGIGGSGDARANAGDITFHGHAEDRYGGTTYFASNVHSTAGRPPKNRQKQGYRSKNKEGNTHKAYAKESQDGRCGPDFNHQRCPGSIYGDCCSRWNYWYEGAVTV